MVLIQQLNMMHCCTICVLPADWPANTVMPMSVMTFMKTFKWLSSSETKDGTHRRRTDDIITISKHYRMSFIQSQEGTESKCTSTREREKKNLQIIWPYMITEIPSWCRNKSFITAVMVWENIFPTDLFSVFHISVSLMISFNLSSSMRYCMHVSCYQCVLQDPSTLNSMQSP